MTLLHPRDYWRTQHELRARLREAKGRPRYRATYQQPIVRDRRVVGSVRTIAPDPMLDLYALRSLSVFRTLDPKVSAQNQVRYGALRQRVVSPLDRRLP